MNSDKLSIMSSGGSRLAEVKTELAKLIKPGITTLEIDQLAERLIREGGDKPSFQMVEGYHHTTCININDGMVHGIPDKTVLKDGDVVKVDVGLFRNGYHLDSAFTAVVGEASPKVQKFLDTGKQALDAAIARAIPGNSIYDISDAIQSIVEGAGYSVIRDLTGHGVGEELHMDPYIPCFRDNKMKKEILHEGQTIAIEVMYTMGDWHLVEDADGWTLRTQDGSVTGMWEHTIYVDKDKPLILT